MNVNPIYFATKTPGITDVRYGRGIGAMNVSGGHEKSLQGVFSYPCFKKL
jgi:hypothetical protein